ncbi:hypothetical protein WN55_00753, partial [Dufourea novaeangliae]
IFFFRFLFVSTVRKVAVEVRGRRGHVAVLRGRDHAPERPSIEHQHRWTPLEPWIAALTLPVTVAGLAQRDVAVRVVVAESYHSSILLTMLLASFDVLRPVAGPGSLVVQKSTYAKLLGRSSVPAGPVPGAGRFVAEYTIKPVAMVRGNWRICLTFRVAIVRPPRIIATLRHAAMFSSEDQTIWTVKQLRAAIHAFPVTIAVFYVAHHSGLCLAGIFLLLLLGVRSCNNNVQLINTRTIESVKMTDSRFRILQLLKS